MTAFGIPESAGLPTGPATADYPSTSWRVGRHADPLAFSYIDAVDARLERAGNRFDVPGGGVLYTATDPRGCFAEVLSRFRPSAKILELARHENGEFMVCGGVARDWRMQRVRLKVRVANALPFVDVEHEDTLAFLSREMAHDLVSFEIDHLDVGHVRGRNRLVTRAIAAWAYAATDPEGDALYSGLRYTSRLGNWECWAVFAGTEVSGSSAASIDAHDADLCEIADKYALRVF